MSKKNSIRVRTRVAFILSGVALILFSVVWNTKKLPQINRPQFFKNEMVLTPPRVSQEKPKDAQATSFLNPAQLPGGDPRLEKFAKEIVKNGIEQDLKAIHNKMDPAIREGVSDQEVDEIIQDKLLPFFKNIVKLDHDFNLQPFHDPEEKNLTGATFFFNGIHKDGTTLPFTVSVVESSGHLYLRQVWAE